MKELGEARFVANELNIQIIHGEDDQTIPLARVRETQAPQYAPQSCQVPTTSI